MKSLLGRCNPVMWAFKPKERYWIGMKMVLTISCRYGYEIWMITSLLNCMMKIMMVFFLLRIFIYFLLLFLTHYHYGNLAPLSCIHSTILSFNSLTPAFPENVVTTPTGGISYNTFIGLWTLLLRYESTLTLYTLLQLGYWKDVHTLIRIIE